MPESNRLKADWWTEEFNAVVAATGHYKNTFVPQIKGIGNWSKAMENVQHSMVRSQAFRHPERYVGKGSTLV
jgi:cation diffusion facilitator CzcD-associated flavoprotein CzcO